MEPPPGRVGMTGGVGAFDGIQKRECGPEPVRATESLVRPKCVTDCSPPFRYTHLAREHLRSLVDLETERELGGRPLTPASWAVFFARMRWQ